MTTLLDLIRSGMSEEQIIKEAVRLGLAPSEKDAAEQLWVELQGEGDTGPVW